MIVEALHRAAHGTLARVVQPAEGVTYAHKIDKAEAPIDWRDPAAAIERRLRAFDPFPGATVVLAGETIKCWRGQVVRGSGAPGTVPGTVLCVDDGGITVACGADALRLTELQRAGGKRLTAAQFLQGRALTAGLVFEPHRR